MGQTLPKYVEEDVYEGEANEGDGTENLNRWKEELLKEHDLDLESQSDIRSSLIDVGRNLEAMAKKVKAKKRPKDVERITLRNNFFVVKERDKVSLKDGKVVNTIQLLVCKDQALTNILVSYDVFQSETEEEISFLGRITKYPVYAVESLAMRLPQLRANVYNTPNIKALLDYLEEVYPKLVKKAEDFLRQGKVTYDGLWFIFERGNRFYTTIRRNQVVGSEVVHGRYTSGMFEPHFQVSGEVIKADGTKFYHEEKHFEIPYFDEPMELDDLNVKPMTKSVYAQLTERGKIFEKIGIGHHYKNYSRFIFYQHSAFRVHYIKADGRVMVDIGTFNRMNPSYTEFGAAVHVDPVQQQNYNVRNQLYSHGNPYYWQQQQQRINAQNQLAAAGGGGAAFQQQMALSEENLYKTWPTVAGFSFAAKAWGEIMISNLSEIKFDDTAYDSLVLPEEKKEMIRALVTDNKNEEKDGKRFTDIISGKGGGVIFLLHGPPGVGKTLTAEAIAELLHRPMYSVSVGELGTTAEQLENKLQEILELASIWDAVVLIDEADIFLEKRTKHDITRNAMVGIFLRKLEYHQGVLFLTTNRVRCFDPAFNSRVSVAIKYAELDAVARAQVWKNLLNAARDKHLHDHCDRLGTYDLNGRQIRTTIRLALAMARSEGQEMSREHIDETVDLSNQFEKELEIAEVWDEKKDSKKRILRLSAAIEKEKEKLEKEKEKAAAE